MFPKCFQMFLFLFFCSAVFDWLSFAALGNLSASQTNLSGERQQLVQFMHCELFFCCCCLYVLFFSFSFFGIKLHSSVSLLQETSDREKKKHWMLAQIFRNTKARVCRTGLVAKYWCGLKGIKTGSSVAPNVAYSAIKREQIGPGATAEDTDKGTRKVPEAQRGANVEAVKRSWATNEPSRSGVRADGGASSLVRATV